MGYTIWGMRELIAELERRDAVLDDIGTILDNSDMNADDDSDENSTIDKASNRVHAWLDNLERA